MAKSLQQVIKERQASQDQQFRASSPIRTIVCPHCNWRAERRRKNAYGDTAYLNGLYAKHLAEYHPTTQGEED